MTESALLFPHLESATTSSLGHLLGISQWVLKLSQPGTQPGKNPKF